jgi:hypothetical protein
MKKSFRAKELREKRKVEKTETERSVAAGILPPKIDKTLLEIEAHVDEKAQFATYSVIKTR